MKSQVNKVKNANIRKMNTLKKKPRGIPFPVGNPGRPKGALGVVTKQSRELFLEIMSSEVPHIEESLAIIRKNPVIYLNVICKLLPYFMPQKIEVGAGEPEEIDFSQWDEGDLEKLDAMAHKYLYNE